MTPVITLDINVLKEQMYWASQQIELKKEWPT